MKVSFSLDQVKHFNSLPAEERAQVINHCNRLSEMNDDAIESYRPDTETPALVAEVHATMAKRAAARRRRSERKAAAPQKAEATNAEAKSQTTELKVTLTEGSGRTAISLRDNFNRFVNQVLNVLDMLKENEMCLNMAAMWKAITELIYKTIHPLADYAKQYMRLPRHQRRPWTFTLPLALD